MIVRFKFTSRWYDKSTPILREGKVLKNIPTDIRFDTSYRHSKLLDMDKNLISDKLGVGSVKNSKNGYSVYIQMPDDIDIEKLKKCYLY